MKPRRLVHKVVYVCGLCLGITCVCLPLHVTAAARDQAGQNLTGNTCSLQCICDPHNSSCSLLPDTSNKSSTSCSFICTEVLVNLQNMTFPDKDNCSRACACESVNTNCSVFSGNKTNLGITTVSFDYGSRLKLGIISMTATVFLLASLYFVGAHFTCIKLKLVGLYRYKVFKNDAVFLVEEHVDPVEMVNMEQGLVIPENTGPAELQTTENTRLSEIDLHS